MTTIPTTYQERVQIPMVGTAPGGQEAAGAFSAGDIIGILKRRMIMIIIVWFLCIAATVSLWYYVWTKHPTWSAEALIQCDSPRPNKPYDMEAGRITGEEHLRFLSSQALYVKSESVLQDALLMPEVRGTNWYQDTPPDDRVDELRDDLVSVPVGGTSFLRVAIGCRQPADPAVIVNAVVRSYLARVQERARSDFRQTLEEYTDEKDRVFKEIKQKRRQLEVFAQSLGPGEISNIHITSERLLIYAEEVTKAEAATEQLRGMMDIYQNASNIALSPEDQAEIEMDPQIATLNNQLIMLLQEREVMLHQFGEDHRDVKSLGYRIDVVEESLARLREQKVNDIKRFKLDQIKTMFLNAQNGLLKLREQYEATSALQADLDRKTAEYKTLEGELEMLEESYQKVEDYVRDIKRIVQAQKAVDVSVAQAPVPPLERSSPRPGIYWPAGTMLGLLLSLGLALLLEIIDTSVRTPQDIVRFVGLPILGTVPDIDDEEVPIDRVETAVHDAPRSMIVEAFRTIRTNLLFSAPPDHQRVIAVCSPRPEDGRTTVACNLAAAIAQGGRRVLLVDANFRRPALQRLFPHTRRDGLSNVLIGQCDGASVVTSTGFPNFDVVYCGPIPPNPAELLGSAYMRDFLAGAARQYDQIVLDAAPLFVTSDSLVLSTMVDGVVLVLRAKANSRGVANRAKALLERVSAHVFGVVLNAAQVRRGGYFREQFRAFYEYQQPDELEGAPQPALPGHEGDEVEDKPKKKKKSKTKKDKKKSESQEPPSTLPDDDDASYL